MLGWALVLIGLGIFNGSYFMGGYMLTRSDYEELPEMTSERIWALEKAGVKFEEGPSFLPFSFGDKIKKDFTSGNRVLVDEYLLPFGVDGSFSQELLDSWKTEEGYQVWLEKLTRVEEPKKQRDSIRVALFIEFGNWLEGRKYPVSSDAEEIPINLKNDVSLVLENVSRYGIIDRIGFSQYFIKDSTSALLKASFSSPLDRNQWLWFLMTFGSVSIGGLLIFYSNRKVPVSSQNDGLMFKGISNQGIWAFGLGLYLIGFYVVLYFFQEYMIPFVRLADPISLLIKGRPADPFFLYGLIYTLVVTVMGFRMWLKYRHIEYQKWRTASVIFFQLCFAFLIPEILVGLNKPYFDFKNIWPLDYDFFFDNNIASLLQNGGLGIFMLFWGTALIIIAVPVMTYFFGKRWYCSWVCGCGGLAETAGDPFRHLSNKSLGAWRIERYLVHAVLVFAVLMTSLVLYTYFSGESRLLGLDSYKIREVYGAWIGAGFAGVVGTGFYPLMGNRVWCRFGCPLAAYLGLVQRFRSRFRITTNGGQCISCGNCSTYCEMGIDVRWYAQRGQNIIRSSCVGCGVCSAVCPRGVLKLENKDEKGRFNGEGLIGQDPKLNDLQLPELPPIDSGPHN